MFVSEISGADAKYEHLLYESGGILYETGCEDTKLGVCFKKRVVLMKKLRFRF